ncbi:hypothetical protein [Streptomyces sp. 7N604]|uniref:hypothetical protein n=1 Tax=Streptomyces sp. 7N604 TaxID=3457415 RepID=UPI003FD40E39
MSGSGLFLTRFLLALGVTTGFYGAVVRPRLLRWGATGDEAARTYPGDELIPYADDQSTMAATLPAPPEEVWPWLQQMGYDRAGWYSWDLLDHFGRPSAETIMPQWQDLKEGDHLDTVPDGKAWFTAAKVDPPRTLVLLAELQLPSGRPFDPHRWPLPHAYTSGVWGFHLEPTPADGTRVVVRTRGRARPRPLMSVVGVVFGEPAHLIMQIRQFQNLRTRVVRERVSPSAAAGPGLVISRCIAAL